MEDLSCNNWKIIQTKTFTKWVNNKLKKANYPTIESLFTDLSSGVAIVNLIKSLGRDIVKFNPNPLSRIQKMENLSLILDFIKQQNISIVNIGPSDIVDGDQKLILGLIWTLISKMSISDALTTEFFSIKEEILNWTQKVTESYENINIENLTTSWQNGMAFNAIIHKFRPLLISNFHSLSPSKAHENCEQAFKLAEENFEIPKLFDAEDIIDVIKPDEKSILTYLSQFYQKFREEEREMVIKENMSNLVKGVDWYLNAKDAYEKMAMKFLQDKKHLGERSSSIGALFKALVEELREIERMNSSLISKSVDMSMLFSNIQDISKDLNLKAYYPPEDLSIDKMSISYFRPSAVLNMEELRHAVQEFENSEAQEIEKIKTISKELCSLHSKDAQLSMATARKSEFHGIHMNSKTKQDTFDKIKQAFQDRMAKLDKFSGFKSKLTAIINDATKLFKSKDLKRTGFITVADFKRIVRLLRLEKLEFVELEMKPDDLISLDRMACIITALYSPAMTKAQAKKTFDEISFDGKLPLSKILPDGAVLKGLGESIDSNNEILFTVLENELYE